jgi:hypothetical protein
MTWPLLRLVCAFAVFVSSATLLAQAPVALSPDILKAVLEMAKAPTPAASYVLNGPSTPVTRNAPLDPEVARTLDPNKIITFGSVYTPFLRAVLIARNAVQAGRPFGAADIPSEIQDNLTYVAALPWERTDVTGPERLVDAVHVIITPPGSTERAQVVQPVRVKPDTRALRASLGAAVPERAMLAAFSPNEIRAGREFVIVYAGTVYAQRVAIRAEDAAAWR